VADEMSDATAQITPCPDTETLTRCVLGALSPDQQELVTAHVDQCSHCQEAIGDLDPPSDEFVESLRIPLANDGFEEEEESGSFASRVESIVADLSDSHDQPTLSSGAIGSNDARPDVVQGESAAGRRAKDPVDGRLELEQLGPYRLLEKLGAGGMGTVYKALHTMLERIVAVKVLGKTRLNDADAVARFQREMKAVGRLEHPHIVHATDADKDGGVHYLVMEFVDGIDLSKLGRRLGPLPVPEACELVRQAAIGLEYVHEHGLVHRDIKPSNLMLTRGERPEAGDKRLETRGQNSSDANPLLPKAYSRQPSVSPPTVKILDLGLALLGSESGDDGLTSTGQVMGTIDYMAPEQIEDTHGVDIRADIYSLGATLYKLLTGHAPSSEEYGSSLKKLAAIARDDAPSVGTHRGDLPAELVAVVDRMLSRDPEDRFATPAEVAEALAPFAEGADLVALWEQAQSAPDSGVSTRQTAVSPQTTTASKRPRRTKAVVSGIAATVLVIGVLAVWATNHFLVRHDPKTLGRPGPGVSTPVSPLAIAPFGGATAKKHQQAWADHLDQPVEEQVDLGSGVKLTMVLIPPGEFVMGSSAEEQARFLEEARSADDQWTIERIPTEGPQHRVRITRAFRLGRHEVTVGQFRQFVDQTGYKTDAEEDGKGGTGSIDGQGVQDPRFVWNTDPGFEQTDDHPVVNVSGNDAMAFCEWLSDKEGAEFFLPSEAQWEYACRAGTTTAWSYGDSDRTLQEYGWFGGNSGGKAHPAGQLKPNGWSLYDMHGKPSLAKLGASVKKWNRAFPPISLIA